MYIGKYRLPIMSSLLIWAVVWEIAGRTGRKLHHSAAVADLRPHHRDRADRGLR